MSQAFNLTAQLNLRGPSNIKTIVADIKRQLGTVQGTVNFTIDPKTTRNVTQLESALRNLNSTFAQTQNNAAAAANAIRAFNGAIGNINSATNNVNRSLNNASNAAQNLGRQTSSAAQQTKVATSEMEEFGKQSALAVRRFAAFSSVTSVVFAFTNALTKGMSAFVAFDKEFVKLQQVTDSSASQLKGLSDEITRLSKSFGVASSDLMTVASTLAQAGLSAKDTERALKALALTDLAPSFDSMNDTVEGSIALMRQFSIGAKDLEKALGSINSVAAVFAVEASDIITAIQRTGGVFASASKGVSQGTDALNEFIAVFTSVRQTTRESAETIATGLRTIFTRIQRESTIEALREFGVVLTDLEGKFVGPYEAVRKLSEGLSRLDPRDLKFSQIVEELGGFRQIGKVIPLIQQFATAQEALGVAQRGQGSLAQDAIKAQLSLANQMAKVREEFLALMRDIGNSDTFQAIAKSALGFASTLIKVADSVKGILPVLAIMGAGKAASGIAQFATGFMGGLKKGPDGQAGGSGGGGGGGVLSRMMGGGGSNNQSNIGVRELILVSDALRNNTSSLGLNTAAIQDLTRAINNSGRAPFARGGTVRKFARGGVVPGQGDRDTVPAMLQPGEFVIRKKAVETIGADNLHSMNKYGSGGSIRRGKSNRRKRFAKGGVAKIQNKGARDGDSWNAEYIPSEDPISTTTRGMGYDAYEINKGQAWEKALGQKATEIADQYFTDSSKMSDSSSLFKSVKKGQFTFGRPLHDVPNQLKEQMFDLGVAKKANKDNTATGSGGPTTAQFETLKKIGFNTRNLKPSEYNFGGIVKRFMVGGKAESTPFGTGETKFPKRITNAYAKELQKKLDLERVDNAFNPYPSNERITIDPEAVSQKFQSEPFDRKRFLSLFNTKISRNELLGNLSDFAKFIGLPGEDLSKVLPQTIDFGGELQRYGNRGTFSRDPFSTQGYDNKGLEAFGFTQADEQDLFGYQKLLDEKTKEIKKIIKTPIETFEDGSFSYDSAAFTKAMDEKGELGKKISAVMDKRAVARKALMEQKKGVLASTGRGFVSMASNAFEKNQPKNVLYHELTHQLFNSLRTKSEDSFTKYKERVSQLFSGDNDDLVDAFDALGGSYNSADVVYGRSYKNGLLDTVLQNLRQGTINSGGRGPNPELSKEAYSMWVESGQKKNAREYRPINPKINEILLKGGQRQDTIDKVEDYGKEEFLTTLIQNAPKLDSNMQNILDSTLNELLSNAGIQRQGYAEGGKVTRNLGYIDFDVINDPANAKVIEKAMKEAGVDGPRKYTQYLTDLAVKARKEKSLNSLKALYGVAGAGKSSIATGRGSNDNGTLRQTNRFPILTPDDITKASEIMLLTSTVSQDKLEGMLQEVDRAYTLSSTTKEEKDRILKQRTMRDVSGVGLFGREAGSTTGAPLDTAKEEALLEDRLGSKSVVLGRKEDGGLRRKQGNELVEATKKKLAFTWGGFAPTTAGHESIMEAAKAAGIPYEDFIALVGANESIDAKSYRTAVFDQDFRLALAKAGFGSKGASVLPKAFGDMSVPLAFDMGEKGGRRQITLAGEGSMAFVADKTEQQMEKYRKAGYGVSNLERTGGISGTQVRDLILNGDLDGLQKIVSPSVFSLLKDNISQLQNRANVLPVLIEQAEAAYKQAVASIDQQLAATGITRANNKKAETDPEYAAQLKLYQSLKEKKKKLETKKSFEPYRLLRQLADSDPAKYGLRFNTGSSAAPSGPSSAMQQAILEKVAKENAVEKTSGILPAKGSEILKRFRSERIPTDSKFGEFSGKMVGDTAVGGKLKYWNTSFPPQTNPDKLAYYVATRDYLISKFKDSQGEQTSAAIEATSNAVSKSKQLGLVGLNPLGWTRLNGPLSWNLGQDKMGTNVSLDASILERGLPREFESVIDYLSGQTENIVGGAAKMLGIEPKQLTKKQRETLGQGNIEGALLEQIFGSADATILDDALRTRPIDFPMGIGAKAAKIFGIDPNIPTEVKRTIDSNSRGKAVEEFQRYFRQQYGIPEPDKALAQAFADGGAVKLYHGSNTGVDDSVLKSFKEKGALSNIAQGYGQGAGFYLYTEKNKAEQQAKMRVGGGSGFTVASGDRSGKPMVLSFNEVLDPKTYDLDYELQKNLVTQWLHDNFDKIKDKAAPDRDKGLAGIRDIITKDSSSGIMSSGIKVQSAEGSRKAIYAGGDSDIREGEILGQIMNRLQSGDPELVNAFESQLFKRPLGLALKYVGSTPLKPSDIETFAQGGQAGISSKDTVPALLTPGEFVINKDAAKKIGYGKLNKLNKADKLQGYNKGGFVGVQRLKEGGPASIGAGGSFSGFDFNDQMISQYVSTPIKLLAKSFAVLDTVLLKGATGTTKALEFIGSKFFGMADPIEGLQDRLENLDRSLPGLSKAIIENGLANKRSVIGQSSLIEAIDTTSWTIARSGEDYDQWIKNLKSSLEQNTSSITGQPVTEDNTSASGGRPYPEAYASQLDYSDVTGQSREIGPSGRKYATALSKEDPAKIEAVAQKLQAEFEAAMTSIGASISKWGKSQSWAKWDIGKQLHMNANPSDSNSNYKLGNPLEDAQLQKEMVQRMVGWETTGGGTNPDTGKRMSSYELTAKGAEALSAARTNDVGSKVSLKPISALADEWDAEEAASGGSAKGGGALSSAKTNKECCECCDGSGGGGSGSGGSGSGTGDKKDDTEKAKIDAKVLNSIRESQGVAKGTPNAKSTNADFNQLLQLQGQLSNSMKKKLGPAFTEVSNAMNAGDYNAAAKTLTEIRKQMGGLAKIPPVNMSDLINFDTSNISSIEEASRVYSDMTDAIGRMRASGQDLPPMFEAIAAQVDNLGNVLADEATTLEEKANQLNKVNNDMKSMGANMPEPQNWSKGMQGALDKAAIAVSLIGQAASNMFDDQTKSGAIGKAVTSGATQTAGAGLALASQALSIPGIGPFAAALVAATTAVVTVVGAFKDAHNAAREFEKALASKNLEMAMDKTALAFEEFGKDIKNIKLLDNIGNQLTIAGSNAQAGQDIENNVPKAFWVNMFDALGANTVEEQKGAADRSKILEKEGISGYLRSRSDQEYTSRTMASYAPEQSINQAKVFKPVADATLQLFENKLKTGTSMEDVMKDLKDASGAPSQLAKNIALSNSAVQEQILLIQQNNGLKSEEKQTIIDGIIAKEAERKATLDLERTLREVEINKLNKATNAYVNSLERTFKQMEASIGKASFELDQLSTSSEAFNAALSGSAKASTVNLKSINVLQNSRAYSGSERDAAGKQAGEFFGGTSGNLEGMLKVGDNLESNIISTINRTIQEDPNASEEKIAAKIRTNTESTVQDAGLSKDLSAKLGTEVQKAVADIRKGGDKGPVDFDQLVEKVPALGKTLDGARRAQELANKALEYWQKNLNEYANAMNQSMEMQLEAGARSRRAIDIQVKGAMDLQKALGKEVTLREQVSAVLDATSRQTKGKTSPSDIGANIIKLNERRTVQQGMSDTAANRGISGKNEFMDMQQRLRNTNMALRDNYDALKNMAENTDIASAALSKINEVQQKRQAGVNMAERLVTSSPEELSKLNSAMARLSNNMAGVQNAGTTADQRKESLDAFNMIAPMLGDDQGAMKANVLESMLGEAGVGVSPMMKDVLDSLRNPEEDPMMREAIETYKMGVNLQSDANSELSRMSQLMSDNTSEIAAEKIAQSLSKVELSFETQVFDDIRTGIRRLVEIEENKKNEAQNAQGKARGGLIYAAAGQMVDFAPKGTDTVPAMLTPGEFVVNRSATQKHLPLLKNINSNKYSSGGKVKYYNEGGYVGLADFAGLNAPGYSGAVAKDKGDRSLDDKDKETTTSYPPVFNFPNKMSPIFTAFGGSVTAVASPDQAGKVLSNYFYGKNDTQESPQLNIGSPQSVLGPGVRELELYGDEGQKAEVFGNGFYPGTRFKKIGNALRFGGSSNLEYKPIKLSQKEKYLEVAKKYIEKLEYSDATQKAINNVKYELPSAPSPTLKYTEGGNRAFIGALTTPFGAKLENLTAPLPNGFNYGLFSGDYEKQLQSYSQNKPAFYGFNVRTPAYPAYISAGEAATATPKEYFQMDPSTFQQLYGAKDPYLNPGLSSINKLISDNKEEVMKTLSLMQDLDIAYKGLTGQKTSKNSNGMKFEETQASLDNKKYIKDLEELYYGTKLSATFDSVEALRVPSTDAQYPVTLYSTASFSADNWQKILDKVKETGSGYASTIDEGVKLRTFDSQGTPTKDDIRSFPYLDSIAADNQQISDIIKGVETDFNADQSKSNVIYTGSGVADNGRYYFTYDKLKSRFFNDTARRFMGAGQDLKEFIVVRKQSAESSGLNPFVDLGEDQNVYVPGHDINTLLAELDKGTPAAGQSGSPGAKPEEVQPYKYNLNKILKATNTNALGDGVEKTWAFKSKGDNNEPELTAFELVAKSYTAAREKALLENQLNEDKAEVKKVFRAEDRDKKEARKRKPGESDADYEARMKTVKDAAKAQAKEEAWTEAKRVTLGRSIYGVAKNAGLSLGSAMPVDIPTVGGVAVELGQYITKMPTDSPQRAMLDAYRAFFAELYNNGETAKSSKEAAEGSDSGSFLKSLGIDVSDKAFSGPGPMIRVPGSTTETTPAYYTSTTNDAAKIQAILARQFMAERSKQFAGALSDEKKEELTIDTSEGGAKIYTVNPDGTKSLRKGEEVVPKSYADIFDIALTPENLFPDADIRQKYLDQLISYYSTAADAQGKALFTPEMSQPFVDSLNVLKTWYKVQDTVLNASRTPEQLLAIRGGLQAVKDGTLSDSLQKQFEAVTGLTVDDVKAQAEQARDIAQQANAFLTTNKYGELPDLDRMIALLNVQAAEKAEENKQQQTQALSSGGVVYASTGKLINFQPKGTDTVPAMLTPGEFVINRAATQKHLPVLEAINSGNYSRGDIVRHLSTGGAVSGYYQTGGPASGGLAGFDFGSFMSDLVGQVTSAITEAAKSAFDTIAKSNTSAGGVSNSGSQNFDGISDFTNKLERISSTLASLDIPKEITITGKHDVNVIINGDQALNQLTPNIKDMVMTELKKGFERLVALNQPVPSDSLKSPYA